MKPQQPISFNDILGQLDRFQDGIKRAHARLTNPRQREILGELIDRIEQRRKEAEEAVPAAIASIKQRAEEGQQAAEEMKATAQERQAERDAMVQQSQEAAARRDAARRKLFQPKPGKPPQVKLDPKLSGTLRLELLERFGGLTPDRPADADPGLREIWQDWNLDDNAGPGGS